MQFIKSLDCNLTVLQVVEEAFSKRAEDELKELQLIFKPLYEDFQYTFDTVRSDEIARGISNYVQLHQADILALHVTYRNVIERLFHKSITKKVTAICNFPLYVFH
jgi:K+-sensing histidine kinase KdpD